MANKIIVSESRELIRADVLQSLRNALVFAGPAVLVLLASFVEIVPAEARYGALALFVLNYATDLLRKFLSENRYQAR
jgi:hypothetical protein